MSMRDVEGRRDPAMRTRRRGVAALGGLAAMIGAMTTGCADSPTQPVPEPASAASFGVTGSSVIEPFDSWDPALWSVGDHLLGRGYLDPDNVAVTGGALVITTPAGTQDGGEILSNSQYRYGTYSARMKCATAAGTVCAFFMYQGVPGLRNDEIDIELLGGTRTMWLTTWVRGKPTNQRELELSFDPSAGYHTYAIEYRSTAVTFRLDGQVIATFTRKLPTRAMLLMANAWWPLWLDASSIGGSLSIDWITAEP